MTDGSRAVAIIQARMGSTRLPGKVLRSLGGVTVLSQVVNRTRGSRLLNEAIVATTTLPEDDAITAECRRLGVRCFRGSEADVLDRYYHAAQSCKADLVVRITADCPLIDAGVIDKTIRAFLDNKPDYASNTLKRTYPRGLDTEVMTADALGAAWRDAALHYQRVHVTPYIYQNPQRFKLLSVTEDVDYSSYRWTLDVPEDLEFIQMIYQQLANNGDFCWRDVVELMERQPELVEINRFVPQKALQEG